MTAYTFKDMPMEAHETIDLSTWRRVIDGVMGQLHFPNGWGISVIRFGKELRNCSHGALQGLYEVAVIDQSGSPRYDSGITKDVIGYQSEDEVAALMNRIAALPQAPPAPVDS